jgi:N-methylhydantoinase B
MIGSVDLGVDRITQIVAKYGREVFKNTCEDLMDYAERRMRAELASFPDGKYSFDDVIENDGIENKPYTVAIDLHINGDELVADYDRSSPQARGPINATLGVATGAVYNGMLHVTDPSIPKNSGCFRPIRVVSPPGKVTNVDYPGPLVAGNTETHPRLANITIGAMSHCVPERAMASESCTGTNFVFGGQHPDYDEYFACYDIMSGGWGGVARAAGPLFSAWSGRERLRWRRRAP